MAPLASHLVRSPWLTKVGSMNVGSMQCTYTIKYNPVSKYIVIRSYHYMTSMFSIKTICKSWTPIHLWRPYKHLVLTKHLTSLFLTHSVSWRIFPRNMEMSFCMDCSWHTQFIWPSHWPTCSQTASIAPAAVASSAAGSDSWEKVGGRSIPRTIKNTICTYLQRGQQGNSA